MYLQKIDRLQFDGTRRVIAREQAQASATNSSFLTPTIASQ